MASTGTTYLPVGSKPSSRCVSRYSSTAFGQPIAYRHSLPRKGKRHLAVQAKKGKRSMRQKGSGLPTRPMPPTPPIDPENEEFVIFVRSKKLPRWFPYSIMKGGWSANALAKSQQNEWGRKLYSGQLVKNIGQALYKEIESVEKSVRENYPLLRDAKELEYGFKIRDRENPAKWYYPENVQVIPPTEEIGANVIDNLQDGIENVTEGFKKAFNFEK